MKLKLVIAAMVGAGCAIALIGHGCLREKIEAGVSRLGDAADALKGGTSDEEHTPRIVRERQRKERIRQDSKWTVENQALHPIEYCQAQLEEVERYGHQLDVQMHEFASMRSSVQRRMADEQGQLKNVSEFLENAKAAYKAAEAEGRWPVKFGSFSFSQTRAKDKIVEAAERIPQHEQNIAKAQANLIRIEKRIEKVVEGQRRLVEVRSRLENTIADIRTRKVFEGEKGIADALNAINDSLASLGGEMDCPTLDEVMTPDRSTVRDKTFNEIMSR